MTKRTDRDTLSLDELSAEVARELETRGLVGTSPDGRVSAVPDARTIRYYTTLGLLDRPAIEGRQARYGRQHVLQILAVKALQSAALPLSEIQARLYGRSTAELESLLGALGQSEVSGEQKARPVVWREVTVEPGLKILAEESWTSEADEPALLARISAALRSLRAAPTHPNGRKNS
jgi:DNA-binding transcriptional MerR regulator